MKLRSLFFAMLLILPLLNALAADPPPVVGLCIAAPQRSGLNDFLKFMEEELGPGGINTLVLRVDYNYAFTSHPELQNEDPLTKMDVKRLVSVARKHGIRLIPQINLLGHQSWHTSMEKLLTVYPEFDENPSVKLPEEYEWPNEDGLYCKSYCPLHPDVHQVVFALVDEILEVFEAHAFHAGMDEVFYIGEEECPRCAGKDKAELFAGEVNKIRDHLAQSDRELWIWGDRLIDGKSTGMGMWEASENDTHTAIDMIKKDVVICDWHYERADPTAALFVLKGFRVITCPWRSPEVTRVQLEMTDLFRQNSPPGKKDKYYGFMQTVWSPAESFLKQYYSEEPGATEKGQIGSFKQIMLHYDTAQ
ncbi:MAG: family 20 glycosylhydrolase [Bacteroidales bacterium]|nr:family 20 glycosylhydrolase [Bacteroidales bacterium]